MLKINELYCGDCFDIMPQIEDKSIDCIIADVPYNISYENTEWDKSFDIERAIKECKRIIKDNGNIIIFQGWSNVCKTKEVMDNYFTIQNWIIYDRIKGRGAKKNVTSTREDILWYCNGNNPTFNKIYSNIKKKTGGMGSKNGQENRSLSNVWYDISPIVPWSKERVKHPTQKPLQLLDRLVKVFSNEGDLILDFTMGSGTTCISCKRLNRNFIGIEKEEKYYKIAKERLINE